MYIAFAAELSDSVRHEREVDDHAFGGGMRGRGEGKKHMFGIRLCILYMNSSLYLGVLFINNCWVYRDCSLKESEKLFTIVITTCFMCQDIGWTNIENSKHAVIYYLHSSKRLKKKIIILAVLNSYSKELTFVRYFELSSVIVVQERHFCPK